MNNDLRNHIAALTATTQAWVDGGEGRWATTLVEDLNHWAEYGIHTPLQLDWYLQACCYVDVYKSAYGHKPYWPDMPTTDAALEASIEEMQESTDHASTYAREQWEAEQAEAEYQRQLEGERTATVEAALKPSPSFTIGDLCTL